MKVEDYFAMFNITTDGDQKKRFLETLFEKARCWASMIKVDELKQKQMRKKKRPSNGYSLKDLPRKEGQCMLLLRLGEI